MTSKLVMILSLLSKLTNPVCLLGDIAELLAFAVPVAVLKFYSVVPVIYTSVHTLLLHHAPCLCTLVNDFCECCE